MRIPPLKFHLAPLLIVCLSPVALWAQSRSVLPPSKQAHFDVASAKLSGDELLIERAEDKVVTRKIGDPDPTGFIEVIDYRELAQEPDGRGGAVIRYEITTQVPVQMQVLDDEGKTVARTETREETRQISRRIRNIQGRKVVLYRDWVIVQAVTETDKAGGIVTFDAKDVMRDLVKVIEPEEELIRCKITTQSTRKIGEFKAYDVNGQLLEESELRDQLVEKQPVVLLSKRQLKMEPFYRQLLNPKLILIYLD